jgi:hypothetical protein
VEEKRTASSTLVRRPERKGQLVKPRLISENNIKMDLKESVVGRGISFGHYSEKWRAAIDTVMNLRVSHSAGNLLTSRGPSASLSRKTLLCVVCLFVNN